MSPTVATGSARVSPEYLRFLREEISSWEYAEAVADCAKLEGIYRAPAARFRFPRPSPLETGIDFLRLLFVGVGLALLVFSTFVVLAPLAGSLWLVLHGAWTMSLVGAGMLAATLSGSAFSLVRSAVHSVQRFVGERLAHQ